MKYTIPAREVEVSEEAILGLIDAAGFGIGYWAESATVDEQAREYRVNTETESVPISFDSIARKALELAAQGRLTDFIPRGDLIHVLDGEIDLLDSWGADIVIQHCIYSEARYG